MNKRRADAAAELFRNVRDMFDTNKMSDDVVAWTAHWVTEYAALAMERHWNCTATVTSPLRTLSKTVRDYRPQPVVELSDILSTVS